MRRGLVYLPAPLLALGLSATVAMAEAAPPADDAPSPAMLEFLGDWMTDDGEWVDPLAMETIELDADGNPIGAPADNKGDGKDDEDDHEQGNDND